MKGFETRKISTLSGGEARRIALARAFVLHPDVLILDEPTSNVDMDNAHRIERFIQSLKHEGGLTTVLATHNMEQAYRLADSVVSIIKGRIVPAHPENIFEGNLTDGGNGFKTARLRGGINIFVDSPLSGNIHLTIEPAAIIVSREILESSARNTLRGRLISATEHGNRVRLKVDAGIPLTAIITKKSFRELALQPGDNLCLTFKTTAVNVF
jgi:molybdopterin-binding protein